MVYKERKEMKEIRDKSITKITEASTLADFNLVFDYNYSINNSICKFHIEKIIIIIIIIIILLPTYS